MKGRAMNDAEAGETVDVLLGHHTLRTLARVAWYRFGGYRRLERAQMAVAWRLPRWLVGWASVRMFAYRTTRPPYGECSGMPFTEIYERWERDRKAGVNDG